MKNLIVSVVISLGIFFCTFLTLDAILMFQGVDIVDAMNEDESALCASGILGFIYFVLVLAWVYIEVEL